MFFFDNEENTLVQNKPNGTSIEKFTIRGLFGTNDVTLIFENEVNIYIGENGLGKTTILNCLYYILHDDYVKLSEISFNEILVKFKNEREISISKADVLKFMSVRRIRGIRYREDEMYSYIESLLEPYSSNKFALADDVDDDLREIVTRRLSRAFGISYHIANSYVQSYLSSNSLNRNGDEKKINTLKEIVSKNVKERVIYLTTYRRIEKDFSDKFELEDERFNHIDDSLIRFGMKDVSMAIKNILETIRTKTNQGFNKMTGVLLSKYSKPNSNSYLNSDYKYDSVKIVLDRLGEQIDEDIKKTILTLINKGEINKSEFQYLRDLIVELIRNYDLLKKYDEKIIQFTETCNKYLNNKRFVYNQSDLTLKIVKEKTTSFMYNSEQKQEEIELSMLSSGEKQIVSLFSRLYLESDNKCILLIDEPELSISMQWQKMLLPDIMRSQNCSLLLTVTHSPFIFDNEFDNYAQDMWFGIKNRGNI